MPFARSARIEIEATDLHPPPMPFVYTIDWHKYLTDTFDEELRFHAAWRRENPAPAWADDFFTLDAVGRGYLLGWSLGVRLRKDGMRWTHSGSENFYLDGEATGEDGIVPHYLRQAGGENTFDAGHGGVRHLPDTYLYAGFPYWEHQDHGPALARHVLSGYRFYVPRPGALQHVAAHALGQPAAQLLHDYVLVPDGATPPIRKDAGLCGPRIRSRR